MFLSHFSRLRAGCFHSLSPSTVTIIFNEQWRGGGWWAQTQHWWETVMGRDYVSSLTSSVLDKNWVTRQWDRGDHSGVLSYNQGFLPDNKEFIGLSRLVIKPRIYTLQILNTLSCPCNFARQTKSNYLMPFLLPGVRILQLWIALKSTH